MNKQTTANENKWGGNKINGFLTKRKSLMSLSRFKCGEKGIFWQWFVTLTPHPDMWHACVWLSSFLFHECV